ncbi:MAG TPA: YceI family protein [Anaeromyxobacteraceae bacterium]|nr:YceI family protein [Anaeromyxobacteraceae bacterium]
MLAAAVALLPLALSQGPAAPLTFAVAPGSTLSYRIVHRLHAVDGVSKALEGRARLLPDGGVQVAVRARVDSFDSGNANRDAHMLEATEAGRIPYVAFKGVGAGVEVRSYPAVVEVPLQGVLDFHGRQEAVEVTARVRFESASRATVEASLPVSLDAHGVERPSLLFVKVDDRVVVKASLVLAAEAP